VATPRRKQSGERRKQSAIGRSERRAPLLPFEHGELMSQNEQLDVLTQLAAPVADQQPQHSREGEIGERKDHAPDLPIARHDVRGEQEPSVHLPLISCEAQRDLVFARVRQPLNQRNHL
jgi:hypothetical protein